MLDIKAFWGRLNKKEKIVAYITIACVLIAFFDGFILKSIFSKVRSVEEEIKIKELQLKKDLKILARKDTITNDGQSYSVYSIEAKSQEEEISSVLREIEILASRAGVSLSDVKPEALKPEKIIKRYSINLTCEANMEQLATFMFLIENSKILFTVDSYSITSKDKEKGILKCNMVISKIVIP